MSAGHVTIHHTCSLIALNHFITYLIKFCSHQNGSEVVNVNLSCKFISAIMTSESVINYLVVIIFFKQEKSLSL